ncbi:MAG: hypothetical protein ACYC3N_10230 [Halothiobacillus sp.]
MAVATIPTNAHTFAQGFFDPLGFNGAEKVQTSHAQPTTEQPGLDNTTLTRMASLFSIPAAIAYLIFVLLYIPCLSTMAAIYRETRSAAWTAFSIVWGMGLAYGIAVLFYQFATFAAHPTHSILWLTAILASLFTGMGLLHQHGVRRYRPTV